MARITDPNDEDDQDDDSLDLEGCNCPKCGMQVRVEDILKMPRPGKWWGQEGKAKCNWCGITFPIRMTE